MKSQTTTTVVRPAALRRGDRVGIIAPASPIESDLLQAGCDALRAFGYEPLYDESILSADLYFAGSVERRARELETMFTRDDVQAIICARGGYGCNYLLPHLNIDVVRRHPKVFVGYSDVTTLLTWFHDATGLITFHGPMVTKDFAVARGVDIPSWRARTGGDQEVHQGALLKPIAPGQAEGKLYGGCLSMLAASVGTPYEVNTEGTILFIEDIATKPYQVDRMLMQLKLAGKLAEVKGLVFGQMLDCEAPPDRGYSLLDVIRRCVADLDIPVAFGLNSGHVERDNLTLPIGVRALLVVETDFAAITMLEPAVT